MWGPLKKLFISLSRASTNIAQLAHRTEAKAKGTVFEKWVTFWKSMYFDYKDLMLDIRQDIREKPVKVMCLASVMAALTYFGQHNPNLVSYRGCFMSYANELLLVHPSLQKAEATTTLSLIGMYFTQGLVRRINLGIASIIWIDHYNKSCKNSESTCSYLQMHLYELKDHIIDVGFIDRWWVLDKSMENYDVNC